MIYLHFLSSTLTIYQGSDKDPVHDEGLKGGGSWGLTGSEKKIPGFP